MAPQKRLIEATTREAFNPPDEIFPQQCLARVTSNDGRNILCVADSKGKILCVELPARFCSAAVCLRRGSYVLIDCAIFAESEGKRDGEVINVVRDEKSWRKMHYWPKEFRTSLMDTSDPDDDYSVAPGLPSDSD